MYQSSAGDGSNPNDRSVRHVLVKQVLNLKTNDSGEFELDGQPLKMILVVGTVTECKTVNNRAIVEIADGTGTLSCTVWSIREDEGYELQIGQYACGYIEVRKYNDETKFVASHIIQPIKFSQVLYHETCALQEHLKFSGKKVSTKSGAIERRDFSNDMYGEDERLKEQVLGVLSEEDGRSIEFLSREFELDQQKIKTVLEELDNAGRTWNDGEAWFLTTD